MHPKPYPCQKEDCRTDKKVRLSDMGQQKKKIRWESEGLPISLFLPEGKQSLDGDHEEKRGSGRREKGKECGRGGGYESSNLKEKE